MNLNEIQAGFVTILGVPVDQNSTFLRGAALGPARIREAFWGESANRCTELGMDLDRNTNWRELGDLSCEDHRQSDQLIEDSVDSVLSRGGRVLSLGGDHSITYPILRAYARHFPELTILHLDAHPDLYDEYEGNRLAHACPFARIMEDQLAKRLVQVGIRTMNSHQREQAERFGVEVIEMRDWNPQRELQLAGPVYLSVDLDCLDPAYAPGVSHHEPGGFTTRELLNLIHQVNTPLVGADIVELNPTRDLVGTTAMVASKLLKEVLGQMLNDPDPRSA